MSRITTSGEKYSMAGTDARTGGDGLDAHALELEERLQSGGNGGLVLDDQNAPGGGRLTDGRRSASLRGHEAAGMRMWNVDPLPGVLSAVMNPSCRVTIW